MYCRNCGMKIDENAAVCPRCGARIYARYEFAMRERSEQSNGMAIAGFVCSFFVPILGWVFGGIGLSRANRREGAGKGFSVAAIVIATVIFCVNLAIIF